MSFSAASLRAALEFHVPAGASGLVVGLSGGADSSALLAAAAALGGSFRGLPLRAVHVDHGLQPARAEFREVCTSLCERLGVPLSVIRISVNTLAGDSLEASARDARYAVLEAQLQPNECLLTAHHRRDQAETLLLQALRGAGVKGLSAMPACRAFGSGWHVRPLLDVPQSDLTQFGAALAAPYSMDPMNDDLRFDRTYLRRLIWPVIRKRWPGVDAALSRTARHMAEAQELLDATGAADLARLRDGDALSVQGLRALTHARRLNAVRLWLNLAGVEVPSALRIGEALRQVFDADTDQLPAIVWGDFALRRYRHRLFLTVATPPRLPDERPLRAAAGAELDLGPNLGSLGVIAQSGGLAAERLPQSLVVRRRAGGETLRPARSARTQSVQHLCQSQGVLPWMRDALPLVFAGDALIAVADLWVDASWCAAAGAPGLAMQWRDAPIIV
jgi:tRNA(Ile)-lysidine synthase